MTFKEEYNLPAYLMLPLVKLDVNSFGKNNLINVFALESLGVVVTVHDKEAVPFAYYDNINYEVDYDEEDHTVIVFNIPDVFKEDFDYMIQGKYSKVRELTKDIIKKKSTLAYKKPTKPTGKMIWDQSTRRMIPEYSTVTNAILKALDLEEDNKLYNTEEDKKYSLRDTIEKELGMTLPKNAELLSKLKEEEYFVK
jgi:hypothetical protein